VVRDAFGGYQANFELSVTKIGDIADARAEFFELCAMNKSALAKRVILPKAQLVTRGELAER
jgi:hypothetical protein